VSNNGVCIYQSGTYKGNLMKTRKTGEKANKTSELFYEQLYADLVLDIAAHVKDDICLTLRNVERKTVVTECRTWITPEYDTGGDKLSTEVQNCFDSVQAWVTNVYPNHGA
jgi:hypothetical protein